MFRVNNTVVGRYAIVLGGVCRRCSSCSFCNTGLSTVMNLALSSKAMRGVQGNAFTITSARCGNSLVALAYCSGVCLLSITCSSGLLCPTGLRDVTSRVYDCYKMGLSAVAFPRDRIVMGMGPVSSKLAYEATLV